MKEIKSPKRVGNDAGDENLTTWDSRFENNEDGQSPERNPVNLVKIRTNAQSWGRLAIRAIGIKTILKLRGTFLVAQPPSSPNMLCAS